MANVENPYETNLSNNLVVTSYVDEQQGPQSDYILRAYSSSLDNKYYPEDYSIEANFKVRPEFYKDNPAEQTVGVTFRNSYVNEALGLTDIKSPLDTDLTGNTGTDFIAFEILNEKDRSVLTAKDFTINEIGNFYCICKVPNLNTKDGWNQFVNMSAFTEDSETSSTNTKVEDLGSLIGVLYFLYSMNNIGNGKNIGIYESIYIPVIFSKEKLNLSTNKPEGWTNVQIHYHYYTALDLYVYFDLQNAYNIIPTSNSFGVSEVLNALPTDITTNEENADANLNLFINEFNKYLESLKNSEKYTDTSTDIILNNAFNIREELNNENTPYRKEAIKENESSSPMVLYNNGLDTLYFDFNSYPRIGNICQLTHPDLNAPLNIVVENCYCFADNSMVSTDKGLVAMKDLTLDHNVKCWDFDNGCITYAKPLFIQTHGKVSRSFEAVFDDGTICKYSKPHRCYCVDTRLFESLSYARNIGKSFYFEDGSIKKLVEWRVVDEPTTVYTMLTDHYMTSFVDGILAGSNMVMIYFIDKDMKYYKKPERKGNRPNNFGIPDKIFRGLRLYESPIPKGIIMRWLKREFISF